VVPGGTIDLGSVADQPAETTERELPRRPPFWACVGVLAAAFLVLGGSLRPIPPLTETVTRLVGTGSSYAVVEDRLYLVQRDDTESWSLAAIGLPAGEELWTAPYAPTGERIIRIDIAGPVLLVSGGETTGRIRRTDAYEAATGRRLWSAPEELVVDADANTGYASSADPPRLRALDLATGRQLWSAEPKDRFTFAAVGGVAPVAGRIPPRVAPESEANAVGGGEGGATVAAGTAGSGAGGSGWLALFVRSGRVELRDARTGTVLRQVTPLGAGALPLSGLSAGGGLVLWFADHGVTGLVGLDPATLDVRWRMPYDIDGGGLGRCLTLVCVSSHGDVLALDPVSGRLRWRARDASYLVEARGRLVALGPVPGGLGPVGTVDPDTGGEVADLRGWRTGARGDPVVIRIPVGGSDTVIALLDGPSGVLRPLASAPEVLLACQSGTVAIVCRTATGALRIWAVRPER